MEPRKINKNNATFCMKTWNMWPFLNEPFYASAFNASASKLTPIKVGVKRANKVLQVRAYTSGP